MEKETIWKFYTTTAEAWQAMLFSIGEAKKTIDLEQYIFNHDSVGLMFIDALKAAAARGIKVRVFCDEVGSYSLSRANIAPELEAAGIRIKFFNSFIPWHPNKESLWYFRDHRKLLIVDGSVGFAGGACLGEAMRDWRESHVKIEGPVVSEMAESFEVMWRKRYHKFKYYLRRRKKGEKESPYSFRYFSNAPLPGKRYMYRELIRAIRAAKHYVYLTTPYFLPDSRLLRNLKEAAKRGVELRILVPLKSDVRLVEIGAGTFFNDLLRAGIRIFRYEAAIIHSKTGVIDGSWSTIGSLNLDNLSLRYNFEGNIVSTDKNFAFELERQFLDDLKLSAELTAEEWRNRPLMRKFWELLVWPIRTFL